MNQITPANGQPSHALTVAERHAAGRHHPNGARSRGRCRQVRAPCCHPGAEAGTAGCPARETRIRCRDERGADRNEARVPQRRKTRKSAAATPPSKRSTQLRGRSISSTAFRSNSERKRSAARTFASRSMSSTPPGTSSILTLTRRRTRLVPRAARSSPCCRPGLGSTDTYLRGALRGAFNIVLTNDPNDDDGNRAADDGVVISGRQAAELRTLVAACSADPTTVTANEASRAKQAFRG